MAEKHLNIPRMLDAEGIFKQTSSHIYDCIESSLSLKLSIFFITFGQMSKYNKIRGKNANLLNQYVFHLISLKVRLD